MNQTAQQTSKPNLLGFSTALGFYRNIRVRELRELLLKQIPRKIEFAELAPVLFQAVMAYAGENVIHGDFSGYGMERWKEIFAVNHIEVSAKEAEAIRKGFSQVGLFDGDKIRSWAKFNKHFAEHEKIKKAKEKAGKIRQQKWAQEAKDSLKRPEKSPSETAPKPEKNGSKNGDQSRQLWFLDKAIAEAQEGSPDWKELRAQRRELLKSTLPKKAAAAAGAMPAGAQGPAARPRKISKGEADQTLLMMARQLLANSPDMLEKRHFLALWAAGDDLPADVVNRFGGTVGKKEAEHNPVPG